MRKRHTREEMQRLFAQRTAEKLTMNALSERSGVSISTLSYWSTKFRREHAQPPALVAVDLVSDSQSASITLEIGGRMRVHVEPGFDEDHFSRVVRILVAQC